MKLLKNYIYLLTLLLLVGGCGDSKWTEPTSTLKPDKIEEITDQRQVAKKMFVSSLTRLPNGMMSATIHRAENELWLEVNHSDKALHELCPAQETCVGGVYASVHNKDAKGEILHRVYKGKTIQIACAWIEFYASEFNQVDKALSENVIGRTWYWVKKCFEE